MNPTPAQILVALGVGALIGGCLTYQKMAAEYNDVAKKYNMLLARDRIKQRVFEEILPQLPDSYTLTEQTQIDIASWNLFHENDL